MYIYRLKDYLGAISYIGITNNINKRISQHIKTKKTRDVEAIEYYFNDNEFYIKRLEQYLIYKYKPKKNKLIYSVDDVTLEPKESEWKIYGE
jgi:excinuclease UvrABC nuclease subunit